MKYTLIFFFSIALISLLPACKNNDTVTGGNNQQQVSHPINSDTVTGNIKGTMLAGKTYYVKDSITVLAGDTLLLQPGVTCYMITSQPTTYCVVFVQGTLISGGTQSQPNEFTVTKDKQIGRNGQGGWGGFVCDSANLVSFKWTRIEYTGGPDAQGNPRQMIRFNANAANNDSLIIEDCWLGNGSDDGMKIYGGTGRILRNTMYNQGSTDGEAVNIKQGWHGDVAYNAIWAPAGSCIKIETIVLGTTTKVNAYNNTLINSGFRRLGEIGYGILCDAGGQVQAWNNIIVNCRYSIFLGPDADTSNCHIGNNLFYATVDSLKGNSRFYPIDGIVDRMKSSSDLVGVDPMFTTFDGSDAGLTAYTDNNNYHLKSGSPAFGKGTTNFNTLTAGKGDVDLGAYTNNTAVCNQH